MTDTDTALILAAGKASGLEVGMIHQRPHRRCAEGWTPWNPLEDHGDAMRLQSRLGLDVQYSPEAVEVAAHQHARMEGKEAVVPWAWESLLEGADPAAATCRAIVRAAAAIAGSAPSGA